MKKLKISTKLLLMATGCLAALSIGCAEDESKGVVAVNMSMGSYVTAEERLLNLIFPKAYAAVTNLDVCFKRLRFKKYDEDTTDPETHEDNVDIDLGVVNMSSSGTSIGEVLLPEDTYRRVEFDLEDDCGTGYSLSLSNGSGNFSTDQRITIKFTGIFEASESNAQVELNVQSILDQLNAYTGAGSLKDAAEAASGDL